MRIAAAHSTGTNARTATIEAALAALQDLDGDRPQVALVFLTPDFAGDAPAVADAVREAAGPTAIAGCTAEAVVAGRREIENEPAVAVWLATVPGEAFAVSFEPGQGFEGWPDGDGASLLLADPFSFPVDALLESLGPESVVVGGMASGGVQPGSNRLICDGRVLDSGAVGVRFPAGIDLVPLVCQGCRPVGPPFTVTRAEGNVIHELAGVPALARIKEVYESVAPEEQALMSSGLLLGRVVDEYRTEFERGDFLVRGVIGGDPSTGALAVGDVVPVGATVRLHVRDAASADEDLRVGLETARVAFGGRSAAGVVVFTCNGRGTRLFGAPDHDAALVADALGAPAAGFFCAGEIGPVGGRNFVHGFTASLAVILDDGP